MTEELQHNITAFEIELVHQDKEGNIKGVYRDEVPVKETWNEERISSNEVGSIEDIFGEGGP
jgi:hypothetical protein